MNKNIESFNNVQECMKFLLLNSNNMIVDDYDNELTPSEIIESFLPVDDFERYLQGY